LVGVGDGTLGLGRILMDSGWQRGCGVQYIQLAIFHGFFIVYGTGKEKAYIICIEFAY
jgi:hypothetical protein